MRLLLTTTALLCLALGSQAQAPAPKAPQASAQRNSAPPVDSSEDDPTQTIRATVNVVLVPTTVTDKAGNNVEGLRPEDFVLYDNDKIQEINRDVAFLPLSLVICVQRTANVEKMLPKIQEMGNVLHDMLVGQDGEVALLSFDHRVELMQDFTNDADKINAAVKKLTPRGQNSRLNDAVNEAAHMLRNKKDRRKVILLIAETLDKSSEAHPREVATNLQFYNIDVYTVNISRLATSFTARPGLPRPDPIPPAARNGVRGIGGSDPTTINQTWGTQGYGFDAMPVVVEMFRGVKAIFIRNPAELYTQFTGGREWGFMTKADLERAITEIGAEVRSQYLLSYNPNNKMEGGFHKIKVDVKRAGLSIRTRPGYWMAAVPE